MSPKTPQKRRLSQSHFPTLYTPVTSKKSKSTSEDFHPSLPINEPGSPLTPDRTPKTDTKRSTRHILPNDYGASSSRSTRLKLEALSKELGDPAHNSDDYYGETLLKLKTPTGLGIREPGINTDLSLHVTQDPNTPKGKIIGKNDNEVWKFVHPENFSSDDESEGELQHISKQTLPNPFIESTKLPSPKLVNPFQSRQPRKQNPRTDYSSKLELYNSRTGKYTVQDLTAREKQIKPKILDFSKIGSTTAQPTGKGEVDENTEDDKLEKKYLMKNLNGFMMDIKPKNSLGFEIFKDDE